MRSLDDLNTLWKQTPPAPRDRGRVELIVLRPRKGERAVRDQVEVSPDQGVHGDRWSQGATPDPACQITLINARVAELVADGKSLDLFGDNFVVDLDIGEAALPVGTRLHMGTAVLEITASPHTGCKQYRERFGADALRWVNHKSHRPERLRGVKCRVIQPGVVSAGDPIQVVRVGSEASDREA